MIMAMLFAGFVLAGLLSYRQHLGYQRVVNELATAENRSGVLLVSGRAKGWLRGAIAVLVIDRRRGQVTRAVALEGRSVFARFRECPALVGPVDGVAERAGSPALARAVTEALGMAGRLTAGASRRPAPMR
jgi:glucitol operon activator protein